VCTYKKHCNTVSDNINREQAENRGFFRQMEQQSILVSSFYKATITYTNKGNVHMSFWSSFFILKSSDNNIRTLNDAG
jgi:hypothetical protein